MESTHHTTATGEAIVQTGSKPLWSRPTFETLALEQAMNTSSVTADSTADQQS